MGSLASGSMVLITSLIPKDFPDPGDPNTAMDRGFPGGEARYSSITAAVDRKHSISIRSAVRRFPKRAVGTLLSSHAVEPLVTMSLLTSILTRDKMLNRDQSPFSLIVPWA